MHLLFHLIYVLIFLGKASAYDDEMVEILNEFSEINRLYLFDRIGMGIFKWVVAHARLR